MFHSRVKPKLARNEPVLVATLCLGEPSIFELTSIMGFDGIWLELEHHAHSVEAASTYIRAARVGVADVIARPGKGEFMRLGRLLEAGARGIMYPRCDDAAEAAEVVRWSKFAPLGERGYDGGNPDQPYGATPMEEYIITANRETLVVVQIEQPSALEQVEAIAAVPGVDVLMLGPADFTVLSGIPGQFESDRFREARLRIAAAARNAGIHWGTTCATIRHVEEAMALGARFICYGIDIMLLKQGLERIRTECSQLGFTFDAPAQNRVLI